MLVTLFVILCIAGECSAEKNAVLVIVDGLGSAYVYPGRSASCVDGSPLAGACLDMTDNASAMFELWVPAPDTESGNAVIVTGYSGASEDAVAYYGATIYDALRAQGYLCMAILETGDTASMIAEPDIIVYERNNSVRNPEIVVTVNGQPVPAGIEDIFRSDPLPTPGPGNDPVAAYRRYDDWSLDKATRVVDYMRQACPEKQYLLVVNVAGPDMAAHDRGYDTYRKTIEGLDGSLSALTEVCRSAGTVIVVTADHGMSFKTPGSRGSHASGTASMVNETRLVPMLVFGGDKVDVSGVYGQQCLAPTLLSLMECPDTLTIADGVPLPLNDCPSLYLISRDPVTATVESPGFYRQVTVNGTCRIGPLEAGSYRLTLPWGVRTVALDRDVTIELADTMQGRSPAGSWVPYVAAAVVSAAGIVAGLGLMRRK
ncbi:MAG: phosphoglyceromutase [Methanocella sp. PtaU1.Bin125]|nr:MAG: phosphoglyceromutase [Methanocella sp. PtaU1.Bin125]